MPFQSSTSSSQNMKFIKKCPCLSSLKTKFYWTQIFFDPPLERSWCEYFELCYGLSPYHLPPSSPGLLLEPSLPCNFKNEILGSVPSISTEVLDLGVHDRDISSIIIQVYLWIFRKRLMKTQFYKNKNALL